MKTRLLNKLNMYTAVKQLAEENQSILGSVPHLTETVTEFKSKVEQIHVFVRELETDPTGYTLTKLGKKEAMMNAILPVAMKLKAYAAYKGDRELELNVGITKSDFKRKPEQLLSDGCIRIHEIAVSELANLGSYGITQQLLDDARVVIDDYANYLGKPRNMRVELRETRNQMRQMFSAADKVLALMDKLMASIRYETPAAFETYMGSREIMDLGQRHSLKIVTGVTGVVTDFDTDEPLEGVKVWTNNHTTPCTTDAKGYYELGLKMGTEILHASKTGYVNYTEEIEIEDKVVLGNDFDMEKPDETEETNGGDSNPA